MIFIGGIFFLAMAFMAMRETVKAKTSLWVNFWVAVFGLFGCIGLVLIAIWWNSYHH